MNSGLLAVRLFGSQARRDQDDNSDVDVLAIVRQSNDTIRNDVVKLVAERCSRSFPGKYISVSVYGIARILEHYRAGSLFAWHLHSESRSLKSETGFSDDVSVLGRPSSYVNAREDIADLLVMIQSAIDSLANERCSLVFEAGMLYLAIRNSAIVASESITGEKRFGRYAAFDVSRYEKARLSVTREYFDLLAQCRSRSVHGYQAPLMQREELIRIALEARRWITGLQEMVNDCSA